MPFRMRRRRYRRYGRGKVSSYRYTPILYYTHRYRNSGAICGTAGFIDSLETSKRICNTVQDVSKNTKTVCTDLKVRSYFNDTQEFQTLVDYYAPTSKQAAGAPYFQSSEELDCLLARYTKYKLVSVKTYFKNFKCLQITVRSKSKEVSEDDRLLIQKYLIQKYNGGAGDVKFGSDYCVPYDKFEIVYQYVPSINIELVYRNHTCYTDNTIDSKDVGYGAGDAPPKTKKLNSYSVLKQVYYPKGQVYLDSNDFYKNKYSSGNFKVWLDNMHVHNYPNQMYCRLQLGPDQYVDSDINTMHLHVLFFDYYYYYRFKFAGINNLDVQ